MGVWVGTDDAVPGRAAASLEPLHIPVDTHDTSGTIDSVTEGVALDEATEISDHVA